MHAWAPTASSAATPSWARIGGNAVVCGGITVGDDAVVAAGEVVEDDVPDGGVWMGGPVMAVDEGKEW
jgi:acetyltransferase-like isoleucine patch superfamily enzyme